MPDDEKYYKALLEVAARVKAVMTESGVEWYWWPVLMRLEQLWDIVLEAEHYHKKWAIV